MLRKICAALAVFALVGALPVAYGAMTKSASQAPCVCCGDACACKECVCDAKGCACDDGGQCECTDDCCHTCCDR